jgi:methylated-DNA-protein-cysteine methyltransferase-like protein
VTSFRDRVYVLVERIPRGKVSSYGRIAAALGYPRKGREVGWALASIPDGFSVPAHRVVNRNGYLSGGWAFGRPERQRARLEAEGVRFLPNGGVDLARHLWPETAHWEAAAELREIDISESMSPRNM